MRKQLERGIESLGISLTEEQTHQLMCFLALLIKWNCVYNLSAIKDPSQMVTLHLLDSLAILPFLHGKRCIDVGTGAGLPGLPLAIARPDMMFELLDSNSKKTRFIQQVCTELGLKKVKPVQNRVQEYQPDEKFDTVTARAFTALPEMMSMTRHLVSTGGQLLAMKSKEAEATEHEGFELNKVKTLEIAGLDAIRKVVVYTAI
ncbi:MAG: 16S rRNA methyltransferase G [Cycloclasticus sp. symbiont of Poecilosclerida sp. M]|nr:MAG: 16S rRNA methyltransferase G [Cycloclasticus sp. symbiont of Poecilosclerida sp. M]